MFDKVLTVVSNATKSEVGMRVAGAVLGASLGIVIASVVNKKLVNLPINIVEVATDIVAE